jgi:hypothetical protein
MDRLMMIQQCSAQSEQPKHVANSTCSGRIQERVRSTATYLHTYTSRVAPQLLGLLHNELLSAQLVVSRHAAQLVLVPGSSIAAAMTTVLHA